MHTPSLPLSRAWFTEKMSIQKKVLTGSTSFLAHRLSIVAASSLKTADHVYETKTLAYQG